MRSKKQGFLISFSSKNLETFHKKRKLSKKDPKIFQKWLFFRKSFNLYENPSNRHLLKNMPPKRKKRIKKPIFQV